MFPGWDAYTFSSKALHRSIYGAQEHNFQYETKKFEIQTKRDTVNTKYKVSGAQNSSLYPHSTFKYQAVCLKLIFQYILSSCVFPTVVAMLIYALHSCKWSHTQGIRVLRL